MRATAAWQPQVPGPSHLFLATASKPVPFQGTLTQQPSSLELDLPQKGWLARWAWPSQRLWGILPDGGLAHLLHDVKELFPPPIALSPVSTQYVLFPVTPQAAWGKWWAQGLTEGKQINIVLI